jgi:FAD/FMN-containing dehydrogenase
MAGAGGKKEPKELGEHEWEERSYEFRVRELGVGAIPGEVLVPMDRLNVVLQGMMKLIKDLKLNAPLIGTVADQNTVMLMPYYLTDEHKLVASTASMGFAKRLGDIARENGGRAVGLGVFFAGNLDKNRGKHGAELIRKMKEMIDPYGIMNPGKMVQTGTRYGFSMPAFLMNFGMHMMGSVKRILPRDKIGEKELSKLEK